MSAPFRDDLDAARYRAEALEHENEDLRDRLAKLQHLEQAEIEKIRSEAAPPLPSKDDAEIVALAESTLERLDRLSEDLDAAPAEPGEPNDAARDSTPAVTTWAAATEHVSPVELRRRNEEIADLRKQVARAERDLEEQGVDRRDKLELLTIELDVLRTAKSKSTGLAVMMFVVGVGVGFLAGLLAR